MSKGRLAAWTASVVVTAIAVGSCLTRTQESPDLVTMLGEMTTPSEIAEAVVGENLKELSDTERAIVLGALRKLAGKKEYWSDIADGSPHRLYRWAEGPTQWTLIVTYEGLNVPDVSWMAIHMFDAQWNQTAIQRFSTGYRIALFDVWKERVPALVRPAISVRLGSVGSDGRFLVCGPAHWISGLGPNEVDLEDWDRPSSYRVRKVWS